MNKKIISFILILSFFLNISFTYAKGNILDNFKKREYEMIFESKGLGLNEEDLSVINTSKKLNIFNNIANSIQESRSNMEMQKEVLSKKILSLEDSIVLIDQEIDVARVKSDRINNQIIDTKNNIIINKQTVDLLQKKVDKNREILMDYMVYLYKKSNSVYDKESVDNLKAIIFSGDDISKIINDLHYKAIIQVTGKTLIDNHRKYISQLYIKTVELLQEEKDLKKLRKELILARKLLSDKKDYKNKILAISKGKESLYQKYITEKIALEKQVKAKLFQEELKLNSIKETLLQKYDCKLLDGPKSDEEVVGLSDKCSKLNKVMSNEAKLNGFDSGSDINIFNWPLYPAKGLSTYFRDPGYKKRFGSEHDAIDIPSPQGTSIVMPADGYAIYIARPTSVDYSYLVMKHSDGYVTVYGHLSEVLVNELDFVQKGKIIAKSGGEYGTFGAGVMTTGAHLHFEIFKDKVYVDPLNYLDTSILPFDKLLEKYRYKFLSDFKERKGYDFSQENTKKGVFVLDGNSEVERQKSLISKYANKNFSDWNIWVEEAVDGGIDPTFVMCLGLAETGLGRNLKTPYNVGNVGNTDSGAVQYYFTARSGIYGIVKTLNNRFLGGYHKISDLSRYGNKSGSIYASSADHWHNNIIKCMSHIKGTYIPDDYNFRLIK